MQQRKEHSMKDLSAYLLKHLNSRRCKRAVKIREQLLTKLRGQE